MEGIRVLLIEVRRQRVVGGDATPVVAVHCDYTGEVPGCHIGADTGIHQVLRLDTVLPERAQMDGVDLGNAQVLRAIGVSSNGIRLHSRLLPKDRA